MQNIVLFGQAANTLETLMIPLSLNKPSYGKNVPDEEIIPQIGKDLGGVTVSPLILGDSAFHLNHGL